MIGGEWGEWDGEDDLLLLVGEQGEERSPKPEPPKASGHHR